MVRKTDQTPEDRTASAMPELDRDPVPRSLRTEDTAEIPRPRRKRTVAEASAEIAEKVTPIRRGKASLEGPIGAMLTLIGKVWSVRDDVCGQAMLTQAPMIAQQMNLLAQSDPRVYRMLSKMLEGGGWGGVIFATWPVAASIRDHHLIPRIEARRRAAQEEPMEMPKPA